VEIVWDEKPYANVLSDDTLVKFYKNNALSLGLDMPIGGCPEGGSTDMGNVSYEVPSIHPMYAIECTIGNHNKGFTDAAGTKDGQWLCKLFSCYSHSISGDSKAQAPTLLQGKAMAMTALDIFHQPELLEKMKEDLHTAVDAAR
jgi:metal-dependent amidase/aminoacylase/carboxypeptidase family protein